MERHGPKPNPLRRRLFASVIRGLTLLICLPPAGASAQDPAPPRFNRDIRPILSDNCFPCHGPDSAKRKAGLRLDSFEAAVAKGAIVPGSLSESLLIKRISSPDPDFVMPPPESKRSLTPAQMERLKTWVAAGAEYEPHWAFIPIGEPAAPQPDGATGWIRNPIDAFVLERLTQEGLAPAPEASKETLIRRVSFDLRGLPPTLAEIDAFLADSSPGAFEHVVDAFLASPAYGERMALDWLDVARYADTYGYQNDRNSQVWPWRDWVIRAFNENLPYNHFITWQVAGDLLENPTQDQLLATAFNRLHRQTNEGGSINEEFRVEYVADRTQTFATAFLGITLECARCHDHKFDPISQKDYYELFAFFNNIDESGMYSHFTEATPSPSMLLYPNEETKQKHLALKGALYEREAELDRAKHEGLQAVAPQATQNGAYLRLSPRRPAAAFNFDEIAEGTLQNAINAEQPASIILNPGLGAGVSGQALRLTGEDGAALKNIGAFERTDPFSFALWLKTEKHVPHTVVFHRSLAELDAASRGYELLLEDGRPTFSLIHFWPGNAVRVQTVAPIPERKWVHVAVTYDGSSRAHGITLYLNGVEAPITVIRDNLFKTIQYENSDGPDLVIGNRFRDAGFKGGAVDEFRVWDVCLTAAEIDMIYTEFAPDHAATIADQERDTTLLEYLVTLRFVPYQEVLTKLHETRVAENEFVETIPDVMVMREMSIPRQAYFLERGQYDQRRDPVGPDTPDSILPFPNDLPRNRLGLAEWLVDRRNPLTARVTVNRYWQLFFGRGLVETAEDFGSQGRLPVYPELLDYLAAWFMDNGWDVKALCKLIVTSATYCQDSTPRPELIERDPKNELLARGPRHRLSAELVRDNALAASELLVDKIGGPSVKPYQPEGLWKEAGTLDYVPDTGENLYRRSMYTFWKRTVPPPSMLTFDATNREKCIARREVTATPLQALVLLNDPQFVETARVLAQNVTKKNRLSGDALLVDIFRRLTSRQPYLEELDILRAALSEQRAYYQSHTGEASQYVEVGDYQVDKELDSTELAAVTAVAQLVFNFDEFQMKQ